MCGVVALLGTSSKKNRSFWASYDAYRALLTLQHRGQDAAGILSYDDEGKRFYSEKNLGLISQVFDQEKIESLKGNMAIAHTRYATVGSDGRDDLQPLVRGYPFGLGMAHNGNILNYHSLVKELKAEHHFQNLTNNDLEVLLNIWSHSILKDKKDLKEEIHFDDCIRAARSVFDKVDGGYAVVGMMGDVGLFGLRDPNGIRPLVLGKKEDEDGVSYCLASETLALNFLGFKFVRDIRAGEVIMITKEGKVHSEVIGAKNNASHCMFEWIYFAGAESQIQEKSVYTARLELGEVLGRRIRPLIERGEISPDIVCPVPDTSRTASISLAESLGLPYREGLIKNRYIQRSFILNTQEKREKAVELKLSPVRSEIEGKKILLVDDSVVRGTTSKKIIGLLKDYGAKEVTLAITCPPLRYGCYYGIDFPQKTDLIATDKDLDQIADWVGANRVVYLSESDVSEAIGLSELCMACVDNKYPTSIDEASQFEEKRNLYKNVR